MTSIIQETNEVIGGMEREAGCWSLFKVLRHVVFNFLPSEVNAVKNKLNKEYAHLALQKG